MSIVCIKHPHSYNTGCQNCIQLSRVLSENEKEFARKNNEIRKYLEKKSKESVQYHKRKLTK